MPFFGKNRPDNASKTVSNALDETINEFKEHYLNTIRSLILFLKQFALDIQEINSNQFKSELDNLKSRYVSDNSVKELSALLNHQAPLIEQYIQSQHAYLNDREKEFRGIIDLLSKAMTGLSTDNQSFYQTLNDHSEKLEQITLLDDIKKIKHSLETEVLQLRQTVRDQKKRENSKIEALANQVDFLKNELEKARTQMQTDALTGVGNRKAFDHYLEDLVEKGQIHGISFALMVLDIDDFKKINDTYGHQVGDRVLVAFAQKCRSLIRSNDFMARYGGEEFIIILPGASLRNAQKKAKEICKLLAGTRYSVDESGNSLIVTSSIGVASLKKNDSGAEIVARADKALYLAKKEGKNRVFTEKDI